MAHHKRGRAKHQRAGCLMCKPWKDERGATRAKPGGYYRGSDPAFRAPPVPDAAEALEDLRWDALDEDGPDDVRWWWSEEEREAVAWAESVGLVAPEPPRG